MMQPLDTVLKTYVKLDPKTGENIEVPMELDLEVVQREYPDGQGRFEVLHNNQLSRSLMSGTFESVSTTSRGGVTKYHGTFLNDPHQERPLPHGQGTRENPDGSAYTGQWKDGFPDGQGEWK